MSIFGRSLVEGCDLLERGAAINLGARYLLLRGFSPREKKEIVDNSGEAFTFGGGRFDHRAVLIRPALARKRDLSFAKHVCDGSAQFVGEIGGELRQTRERILQTIKHRV